MRPGSGTTNWNVYLPALVGVPVNVPLVVSEMPGGRVVAPEYCGSGASFSQTWISAKPTDLLRVPTLVTVKATEVVPRGANATKVAVPSLFRGPTLTVDWSENVRTPPKI